MIKSFFDGEHFVGILLLVKSIVVGVQRSARDASVARGLFSDEFEEMFLTMIRKHKGIIFGNNAISRTDQFVQPYTDLDDFTGETESV